MGRQRARLHKLAVSFALLAGLTLALPAFASATRVLYSGGHDLDTARLATFGGNTLVDVFDGCSDSEWATALARTDFDVLMVGESAPDCGTPLSAGTMTAIDDYVRAGHRYIQTGAHQNEAGFMNALFGFSTANVSDTSSETLTGTLRPAAAGTPFAGGPATLTDPSATELLSGTPGKTIYSGPEGTWAFTTAIGKGVVTYLGWDYCCGSDGPTDDWYRVLNRALKVAPESAPTTPVAPVAPAAPTEMCMGRQATIVGTPGNDNLVGTAGPDVIVALGGADKVKGLGGADVICGRMGKDKLKGGAGNDKLQGNKSSDRLIGNGGKDACRGGLGKDSAASCESVKGL